MAEQMENYGLDEHCLTILNEYREKKSCFQILKTTVLELFNNCLKQNGIQVTAIEAEYRDWEKKNDV